ncbi:MAG: LysM domain-containing protein [Nocardioides sp.]|uniref:LysM peptidoglycan-binding domain-containing protein n=1 Tax=Nocardioides sp. TaxID=35761 RepID=UPI0039E544DF
MQVNRGRQAIMWLASLLVAGALASLALPELRSARRAASAGELAATELSQWLVWLAAAACAGCAVWLAAVSTVVVATAGTARQPATVRTCPALLRRWLLVGCGVLAVSALASPARAEGSRLHPPEVSSREATSVVSGLPLPDRAVGGPRVHTAGQSRPTTASQQTSGDVVVQPGDSLWAIAASALPPGATAAEIDDTWRRLYELNRSVIGADPDLIMPGTHLTLPDR